MAGAATGAKLRLDSFAQGGSMPIVKTAAGQQVLKDRALPLLQRQRAALILFDGRKTVAEVLQATAAMGVVQADIDHLFGQGLLSDTLRTQPLEGGAPAAAEGPAAVAQPQGAVPTPQERYAAAYPVAIQLTAALGLRGFRLNLAVEAAGSFEELLAVAPRIREAVGAAQYEPLGRALGG
jgi:hypothetical protein